jgi:hypothetical protein
MKIKKYRYKFYWLLTSDELGFNTTFGISLKKTAVPSPKPNRYFCGVLEPRIPAHPAFTGPFSLGRWKFCVGCFTILLAVTCDGNGANTAGVPTMSASFNENRIVYSDPQRDTFSSAEPLNKPNFFLVLGNTDSPIIFL